MRAFIALLLIGGLLACRQDGGNTTETAATPQVCERSGDALDAAAWRADLHCAVHRLEENHPQPYGKAGESAFRAAVRSLEDELSGLEDVAIAARLMSIVALANDAHTYIDVPATLLPHAPVAFRRFDDGVYVLKAPEEHADAAGKPLAAINGLAVTDILAALAPLLPDETPAMRPYQAAEHIDRPGLLWATGVSGERDRAQATIAGREQSLPIDATMNATLVAVPDLTAEHVAASFRGRHQNYRVETLPALRLLYVQYNLCFQDPAYPMAELAADVERLLDAGDIDRVLVDVRGNPGGYDVVIDPLLATLREHPVTSRDDSLYVAIGPATYSASLQNAIEMRDDLGATLIGSATTERANHFGGVRYFTLPNSGIRLSISTRFIESDPGTNGALLPDIELPRLGSDYVNGVDPVFEWFKTH